eukprot:CAMPEP_0183726318 /NCGR_PEP_ID=MMETSP0737-20130205/23052_1 /TAXON_ID=385413 /ORGANISM="Thalassiosira miniscula, Strain CCMP1093" /LENGTH=165 /DNA_ID=CAMNT_0025957635 /DNA_START=27 /DNA_END=524 /DNA_ORIENTATION=-
MAPLPRSSNLLLLLLLSLALSFIAQTSYASDIEWEDATIERRPPQPEQSEQSSEQEHAHVSISPEDENDQSRGSECTTTCGIPEAEIVGEIHELTREDRQFMEDEARFYANQNRMRRDLIEKHKRGEISKEELEERNRIMMEEQRERILEQQRLAKKEREMDDES